MYLPVADVCRHATISDNKEIIYKCIAAALKTSNDIACGDMARVQRSLAKYGSPKPKTNPEKNEEQ